MNETELRDRFREVIAASSPPRAMDTAAVLETARRARGRRRAVWAGVGTVVAVVAIAVTATVVLSGGWLPNQSTGPVGNGGASTVHGTADVTAPNTEVGGSTGDTKMLLPTGPDGHPQQDRTADAGPGYEAAAHLLDELIAVVPPGYTVPESQPEPPPDNTPYEALTPDNDPWARFHQAQFVDRVNDAAVWEYLASLAVSQDDATGHLLVQVLTPGNSLPTDPCQLARSLWGLSGDCQVTDVAGQQVGVMVRLPAPPQSESQDFEQVAAYRHPDGTAVFVAQTRHYRGARADLPQPLFSVQQLAELAASERFHIV